MLIRQILRTASSISLAILLLAELTAAQNIPGFGREHTELTRLRPAQVHLANQTIQVKVKAVDSRATDMTERMRTLVTNRVIGVNKNLREVSQNPYYLVDCSITRYDYNEKTEQKKEFLVKDKGTFKIITAMLEASFNVVRVSGNVTLHGGNITVPYKKEFEVGVEIAPVKAEVENALLRLVVEKILVKVINTEEKLKVRLMGKGELSRFARLAQAGQWAEYIQSVRALPEEKPNEKGESSFEGDRHYNLSIAHEARFYETMWEDYNRAERYYDLADTALRKARQYDPREKEYIEAQARLGQSKKYFDTIRERFPKDFEVEKPESAGGERAITSPQAPSVPGAMTNKEVIDMVNAGVAEKFILEQINEATVKRFDISSKGIIQLTKAGVSEKIIDAIKGAMRRQAPPKRTQRKRP